MSLMTVTDIRDGLEREFLPLEPMLSGFRLVSGGVSSPAVRECERQLGVTFPDDFRALIQTFDFGNLTIGPVAFCETGNYLERLIRWNTGERWWGDGARPESQVIAISDPYTILLDAANDTIWDSG